MTSPFYYANLGELNKVDNVDTHNDIYRTVVNYGWAGDNYVCTWVIQPKDTNLYGSFGDYAQRGFGVPTGNRWILANKKSPAVKVATGFTKVGNIISRRNNDKGQMGERVGGLASVTVYWPTCSDSNFVGIGLVFGRPDSPPSSGQYYCLHKSYVKWGGPMPENRACAWNSSDPSQGMGILRELGWHQFLTLSTHDTHLLKNENISLILSDDVYGQPPLICDAESIKNGGYCSNWCDNNRVLCDSIKNTFCASHPSDSFCDCINSPSRPEYIDYVTKLKPEYQNLPFGCNSKACNQRKPGVDVFKTEATMPKDCPSFSIIDQSVKVSGVGNIVDAKQQVVKNVDTGVSSGGTPATGSGSGSTHYTDTTDNTTPGSAPISGDIMETKPTSLIDTIGEIISANKLLSGGIVLLLFAIAYVVLVGDDQPQYDQYAQPQYGQYDQPQYDQPQYAQPQPQQYSQPKQPYQHQPQPQQYAQQSY